MPLNVDVPASWLLPPNEATLQVLGSTPNALLVLVYVFSKAPNPPAGLMVDPPNAEIVEILLVDDTSVDVRAIERWVGAFWSHIACCGRLRVEHD